LASGSPNTSLLLALRQFDLPLGKPVLPAPERRDRAGECLAVRRLVIEPLGYLIVDDVEPFEVVGDLPLGVGEVARQALSPSDVLRAGHCPHLRPVERDHLAADQALFAAELHERGACTHDRFRVVVPKRGDGAIVGREPAHQPERLQIARAGTLEVPRRADLV